MRRSGRRASVHQSLSRSSSSTSSSGGLHVEALRQLAEQVVVEHVARDRRRGARAEAAVLDHDRERDLRALDRREGDEQRMVAVALGDLLLVVLLVLLHARSPAPCRSCRRSCTARRRRRAPPVPSLFTPAMARLMKSRCSALERARAAPASGSTLAPLAGARIVDVARRGAAGTACRRWRASRSPARAAAA